MQRAQQPVGLKYGLLYKCSQKLKMWSSTWFVLGASEITYYKRGAESPKTIDLQQPISIIAADVGDTKRPHSFKLTTKAFRTLIVAAETSEQADEWVAAIRTVATIYGPPPEGKEGVIKLNPDQKSMLECTNQIVQLTGKLVSVACQSNVPGVYSKLILDNLSVSALMCSTTGRVVVFKPKVQTGSQRFTSSVVDTQALLVKYKHAFQAAKNAAGVREKGKDSSPITSALEGLIAVMERTVSTWMPSMLDSDLTKPLDEMATAEVDEEEEGEKAGSSSPYVTPFLFDTTPITSSPAPCKKHWDLLIDECAGIITYMESIGKGKGAAPGLKQPSPATIEQAKVFLNMSKRLHEIPSSSAEVKSNLPEEQFSLMKQHLLGSVSTIDYHTANIGLLCDDAMPPQVVDIISHAYGISSAISRLPRAIRKHRTQTLVSAVENIGSFSFSLSKLITQMVDHESLRDARGRQTLREEVHAIQYIALHMLGMCTPLVEGGYQTQDVLAFADTAKLLALSVTNTLESVRLQLVPAKRKRGTPRKLASELTDAATGSMVFWFGLVGQNASVHLAA